MLYSLIEYSINRNNKYSTKFLKSLEDVTKFHKLEIEGLNLSFYISNLRTSGESDADKEARYGEIKKEQEKVRLAEDVFSLVLSEYYIEEKEMNRFRLFYFFLELTSNFVGSEAFLLSVNRSRFNR